MGRLDLPPDENIDLEELEGFAKEFKQRRIKLGKFHTIYLYDVLKLGKVGNKKHNFLYLITGDEIMFCTSS